MLAMAQDSDSPLETLDSSLSHTDRITIDHHQSSSSSSATTSSSSSDRALSRNSSLSRLNAQAPEFVPRSSSSSPSSPSLPRPDLAQAGLVHVYPGPNPGFRLPIHGAHMAVPVQTHHPYPHHVPVQYHHQQRHRPQYYGGGPVDHHHEVAGQAQQQAPAEPDHTPTLRNGVSEEAAQKIINQVEYYFSDLNLATTDHLMRFINKDAEGYVPISVVASFKKIKALISSNSQLASILRDSAKLVVSEDGKKVKRQHPLTELDMEELQSRIVVAENLPEDHCHQNLMKVFSAVGSVKTIRTCQPQTSNGGASSASRSGKADNMLFSNKLHAFVEYESVELADKAVAELNDEANWRSGLRVRLFVRHTGKSAQPRGKKFENEVEVNGEEDDTSSLLRPQMNEKNLEDSSQQFDGQSREHTVQGEEHINDRESGQKKGRTRGRGKGRGGRPQSQYHHHHNHHQNNQRASCHVVGTPPSEQQPSLISKQPPGPRMPDGTRGFSMGRGKPVVTVNITA